MKFIFEDICSINATGLARFLAIGNIFFPKLNPDFADFLALRVILDLLVVGLLRLVDRLFIRCAIILILLENCTYYTNRINEIISHNMIDDNV